ncbi:MAG: LysM peptidoglycan-binding domain-containing protein [candidate division KSB1 bacterium]|nr:LysM peptidoglycan-binding domain-containing protein [candidate division KSB1 bacterium]MDZ7317723.1 LysM peptidoglycan-binding domain-containing protein [candidate division KSB1 bacterium]MDZ7340236.1 LysM peptidoglycan-binding domain-containing protein [candidate division KSB1 bacterium]
MNDFVAVYERFAKGVKRMLRYLFLLFFAFVMLIVLLLFGIINHVIKIDLTPNNESMPSREIERGPYYLERLQEPIPPSRMDDRYFDWVKHPIERGETLFDLEKKYGTNWKVIGRVNRIEDPLRLDVGRIVYIPVKKVES